MCFHYLSYGSYFGISSVSDIEIAQHLNSHTNTLAIYAIERFPTSVGDLWRCRREGHDPTECCSVLFLKAQNFNVRTVRESTCKCNV